MPDAKSVEGAAAPKPLIRKRIVRKPGEPAADRPPRGRTRPRRLPAPARLPAAGGRRARPRTGRTLAPAPGTASRPRRPRSATTAAMPAPAPRGACRATATDPPPRGDRGEFRGGDADDRDYRGRTEVPQSRPAAPGQQIYRLDDLYRMPMPKLFALAEKRGHRANTPA